MQLNATKIMSGSLKVPQKTLGTAGARFLPWQMAFLHRTHSVS